ncbi:hypothetical protein [Streptomyces sp. AS58]|uniref:hypothetical protein n=1 Tax=Streptomyces sp. AS58 TaxID=1519489 RepID=UPI000B0EFEAD|nr:hypothetical protein [Streptomyces sp. AS58]
MIEAGGERRLRSKRNRPPVLAQTLLLHSSPVSVEGGGSAGWLFDILVDGRPKTYLQFAEEYCEVTTDIEAICHVYVLRPLTQSVVAALNPHVELVELAEVLAQIEYPVPGAEVDPEPACSRDRPVSHHDN